MIIAFSLHPPQRGALAVERRLDVSAGASESRHDRANRHALDVRDVAIAEAFEHHKQQHRTLFFDQHRQRAGDVAAFRLGAAGVCGPSGSGVNAAVVQANGGDCD